MLRVLSALAYFVTSQTLSASWITAALISCTDHVPDKEKREKYEKIRSFDLSLNMFNYEPGFASLTLMRYMVVLVWYRCGLCIWKSNRNWTQTVQHGKYLPTQQRSITHHKSLDTRPLASITNIHQHDNI